MTNMVKKSVAILIGFALTAAGLWATGAEEAPAAAADKNYVTDPATGKVVTAPEYGGTLTYPDLSKAETTDPFITGHPATRFIGSVNEKLAWGDWSIDRDLWDFTTNFSYPTVATTGSLAESWEQPDDTTIVVHIRPGVHWHDKPPMNGRELTADDVVYTFQRNTVQGDFTERPLKTYEVINLPWESIEATDKYTVVFKLKEPYLGALKAILSDIQGWILPPEVIEQYGDYADWRNVVGTGSIMLTDYVEGVSITWDKNPDYWGYDPKYPENRLPYIDRLRLLYMPEEATRLSALRTGQVDIIHAGTAAVNTLDVVKSLQRTNPEVQVTGYYMRAVGSFSLNVHKPPFDDVRVRHALQMALDLETINDTYFGGYAKWEPMGMIGYALPEYYTPFEDFPEEVKQYYRYDPEGAEKLLDEAGYPRGADGVRFKVNYDHVIVDDLGYAEIAVGYWAAIGVDVEIDMYDGPTWYNRRNDGIYHMTLGDMGFNLSPSMLIGWYRGGGHVRHYMGGDVDTPEMTAAYEAFFAATTVEEQQRAFKEFDMAIIKHHNQIYSPMAPRYQVAQPWVKGYNGEWELEIAGERSVLIHLWIDQDLKEEMGF